MWEILVSWMIPGKSSCSVVLWWCKPKPSFGWAKIDASKYFWEQGAYNLIIIFKFSCGYFIRSQKWCWLAGADPGIFNRGHKHFFRRKAAVPGCPHPQSGTLFLQKIRGCAPISAKIRMVPPQICPWISIVIFTKVCLILKLKDCVCCVTVYDLKFSLTS